MSTNVRTHGTSADEYCTKLVVANLQGTLDEVALVQAVKKRLAHPVHFILSKEARSAKAYRRWWEKNHVVSTPKGTGWPTGPLAKLQQS